MYSQPKEYFLHYISFETKTKYFMIIRKMQIKNKCSGIVFVVALNHSLNLIQVDPRKLRKTLLISWFILPGPWRLCTEVLRESFLYFAAFYMSVVRVILHKKILKQFNFMLKWKSVNVHFLILSSLNYCILNSEWSNEYISLQ